ncbi:hypothetical protein [Streptomyces sp. NRRL WC-3742]|uniref:hypothetical protein n=1 Tax=Streptomyces sp. NRRL WC-3742 TaxID=1463934 RepID=UPI0004C761D4|nr:hypothetical protein [Streptomyces sp. NRRL WC-3742]
MSTTTRSTTRSARHGRPGRPEARWIPVDGPAPAPAPAPPSMKERQAWLSPVELVLTAIGWHGARDPRQQQAGRTAQGRRPADLPRARSTGTRGGPE